MKRKLGINVGCIMGMPQPEQLELIPSVAIRDVWQKKDLPAVPAFRCDLPPHGACILRVSPA